MKKFFLFSALALASVFMFYDNASAVRGTCPPGGCWQTRLNEVTIHGVGTYAISGGVIINTHSGRVVSYKVKNNQWVYTDIAGTGKEFMPVSVTEAKRHNESLNLED